MYGYAGIRPYEETCDQYTWYGTRVRCSFKNLCQQKLLKLYNKLSRLLFALRCFFASGFTQVWWLGGCMFQHCWALVVGLFSPGFIKPRAPKPAPDAPFSPGFCRWDVSIRWAAQMGSQEATWDQLIRVACELPNWNQQAQGFKTLDYSTKESPRISRGFWCYPCQVSFGSFINHVFISCEIKLRNPTKQETSNVLAKEPQRPFHLVDSGDLKKLKMSACWVEQGWTHQFVANLLSGRAAEDLKFTAPVFGFFKITEMTSSIHLMQSQAQI